MGRKAWSLVLNIKRDYIELWNPVINISIPILATLEGILNNIEV